MNATYILPASQYNYVYVDSIIIDSAIHMVINYRITTLNTTHIHIPTHCMCIHLGTCIAGHSNVQYIKMSGIYN